MSVSLLLYFDNADQKRILSGATWQCPGRFEAHRLNVRRSQQRPYEKTFKPSGSFIHQAVVYKRIQACLVDNHEDDKT